MERVVERPPDKGTSCRYVEIIVKCCWQGWGGVRDDPDVWGFLSVVGVGRLGHVKIRSGIVMLCCLCVESIQEPHDTPTAQGLKFVEGFWSEAPSMVGYEVGLDFVRA